MLNLRFFFILSFISLRAQTVIVTGVAGFIGAHICKRLLERGDTVIGIDNFFTIPDQHSFLYYRMKQYKITQLCTEYPQNFIFYQSDITDFESLSTIFSHHSIDLVCHLAALGNVRYSLENPQLYIQYNILGTVNILEAMKNHEVTNMVLASSSSVYGDSHYNTYAETSQDDNQLKSPYAISKRTVELYAKIYHELYNMNITCLRLFTVYGEFGRMDMAPFLFMDAICTEKPIRIMGDGFAKRDFTFIQDAVNGFISAIDKPLGYSVINIGSGTTIFISDFIKEIEKIVGKNAILIYDKPHQADVLLTCADISKAQELLNYKPSYSCAQGLRLLYDWYCTTYQTIKALNV